VSVTSARPGTPVRVLGLRGVPPAGAALLAVADEAEAKAVVDGRRRRAAARELLRVAAADAVKRSAERGEYTRVRERRAAYKAALARERSRRTLRKAGAPMPPDLELQPWEALILREFAQGKVTGVSARGKDARVQGGQQADVALSHGEADAGAAAAAAAAAGAGGGAPPPRAAPKPVAFIVRSDSAASLVALGDALARIGQSTDEVLPRVVHAGVGEVTEADVQLAADTGAHILAFNAKVPAPVQRAADRVRVRVAAHRVIYSLLDAACDLLAAHLAPGSETETAAVAEVRQVFALNANRRADPERVAGCVIIEGTFARAGMAAYRVLRGEAVVGEAAAIGSLMHFKDKVEAVKKGDECGLSLAGFTDLAVGDKILALRVKAVPRKLTVKFD
jgi:translation initiation factor IF-2